MLKIYYKLRQLQFAQIIDDYNKLRYFLLQITAVFKIITNSGKNYNKYRNSNKPMGKLFPSLPKYGERYVYSRKRPVDNKNNLHLNLDFFINSFFSFDLLS